MCGKVQQQFEDRQYFTAIRRVKAVGWCMSSEQIFQAHQLMQSKHLCLGQLFTMPATTEQHVSELSPHVRYVHTQMWCGMYMFTLSDAMTIQKQHGSQCRAPFHAGTCSHMQQSTLTQPVSLIWALLTPYRLLRHPISLVHLQQHMMLHLSQADRSKTMTVQQYRASTMTSHSFCLHVIVAQESCFVTRLMNYDMVMRIAIVTHNCSDYINTIRASLQSLTFKACLHTPQGLS